MYLVDSEIRKLIKEKDLIENVPDESIGAISCDLCIEYIIHNSEKEKKCESFDLLPGETIIVATKEIINMPEDMIAHIIPKNSRLRMGISIDAPVYQPGHHTKIFISVTNTSANIIELRSGEQIAAIAFSKLSEKPENIYSGGFNNEYDYKGLAHYKGIWDTRMKQTEDN